MSVAVHFGTRERGRLTQFTQDIVANAFRLYTNRLGNEVLTLRARKGHFSRSAKDPAINKFPIGGVEKTVHFLKEFHPHDGVHKTNLEAFFRTAYCFMLVQRYLEWRRNLLEDQMSRADAIPQLQARLHDKLKMVESDIVTSQLQYVQGFLTERVENNYPDEESATAAAAASPDGGGVPLESIFDFLATNDSGPFNNDQADDSFEDQVLRIYHIFPHIKFIPQGNPGFSFRMLAQHIIETRRAAREAARAAEEAAREEAAGKAEEAADGSIMENSEDEEPEGGAFIPDFVQRYLI
jgi:hypothetical protein